MTTSGNGSPPRRDGGMVTGGAGYSLDELAALGQLPVYSSGSTRLDELTGGGISPGSIWTAIGPAGVGLTSLALQLACAASGTGDVLVVNGHVPTHVVASRMESCLGVVQGDRSRIKVASWKPAPVPGRPWDTECKNQDVIIFDTWDEQWRPAAWRWNSRRTIETLRHVRELAQQQAFGVLLTARVNPVSDPEAYRLALEEHPLHEAFADVSDVRMAMSFAPSGHRSIEISSRIGSAWRGEVRLTPHDRLIVLADRPRT